MYLDGIDTFVWMSRFKKYPTECKESPSQTEEQVLWPSYEQTDVLSDGNLALVDFTHKDDGYICARLLQEVSGIKLQIQKMIKNIIMI